MNDLRLEVARILGWKHLKGLMWRGPSGRGSHCYLPDWPNDPGAVARDVLPALVKLCPCGSIVWSRDDSEWAIMGVQHSGIHKTFAEAVCRAYVAASLRKDG